MDKIFLDYGPLALAFVGDSVLETLIRKQLVLTGTHDTGTLTEISHTLSCANSQSERYENIKDYLNEVEQEVFLNARNHKSKAHPKSASAVDYKRSTGFEAIFGYLYLKQDTDRLNELFNLAYKDILFQE